MFFICLILLMQIFFNMEPKKISLFFILFTMSMILINTSFNIFWMNYFIILMFLSGIFVILVFISSFSNFNFLKISKSFVILFVMMSYFTYYNNININLINIYKSSYLIIFFIILFIFLMFFINFNLNIFGSMRKF